MYEETNPTEAELSAAWSDWEDSVFDYAWNNRPWWQRWIMRGLDILGPVGKNEWHGW